MLTAKWEETHLHIGTLYASSVLIKAGVFNMDQCVQCWTVEESCNST